MIEYEVLTRNKIGGFRFKKIWKPEKADSPRHIVCSDKTVSGVWDDILDGRIEKIIKNNPSITIGSLAKAIGSLRLEGLRVVYIIEMVDPYLTEYRVYFNE